MYHFLPLLLLIMNKMIAIITPTPTTAPTIPPTSPPLLALGLDELPGIGLVVEGLLALALHVIVQVIITVHPVIDISGTK